MNGWSDKEEALRDEGETKEAPVMNVKGKLILKQLMILSHLSFSWKMLGGPKVKGRWRVYENTVWSDATSITHCLIKHCTLE